VILQIIAKLQIVHGDLSEPGCGISTADQTQLKSDVQYVVHSAASIRFDNPVHTDLKLSYVATKALADMATGVSGPVYVVMRRCCTANKPFNELVKLAVVLLFLLTNA